MLNHFMLHVKGDACCRVDLVKDVLADTPEAKGRLIIDLINEPMATPSQGR